MKIEITITDEQFAHGEQLGGAVALIERIVANEAENWADLVEQQDDYAVLKALQSDKAKRAELVAAGRIALKAEADALDAAEADEIVEK